MVKFTFAKRLSEQVIHCQLAMDGVGVWAGSQTVWRDESLEDCFCGSHIFLQPGHSIFGDAVVKTAIVRDDIISCKDNKYNWEKA